MCDRQPRRSPTSAQNKMGAEMFMNYILRPEVSKLISDKFPYTNPNAEARKLLTAGAAREPGELPAPASTRARWRPSATSGRWRRTSTSCVTDLKAAN